jgi:hypothetical protein
MERVFAEVRVAREEAVNVLALVTNILFPAFKVRLFAPPDESVPAPAKPREVAETLIVSMEATPVTAPTVVTLRPPLEVRANVPVAFPTVTLFVPVPRDTAPLPFRVNPPLD